MIKFKVSQRENNLFFAGLLSGIVGGLLANYIVTSFFKLFDNLSKWIHLIILILSLIFYFGLCYFLFKQIKPK